MTGPIIWMFGSAIFAGAGIVAITFASIHADQALSRKKKKPLRHG